MQSGFRVLKSLAMLLTILAQPLWSTGATAAIHQDTRWVAVWGASPMASDGANALPADRARDVTLRQVVRASAAGTQVRLRLSNVFGAAPLQISAATLAPKPASGQPAQARQILFGGQPGVMVPQGADYWSDPIEMAVPALSDIVITLHVADAGALQTGHPGARATTLIATGDQATAATLGDTSAVERWYFISGLEVSSPDVEGAIVLLGDSIIDGYGVPADSNGRWSDRLAERVQADPATRNLSVVNEGIGGNRLLADGLGPNALARLERDVLSQSGVRYVLVLEGVNDLGVLTRDQPVSAQAHAEMVARIIGAYQQIILRAHQRGVRAIGATIMPFAGSAYYHPGPETEADRHAINAWIRTPGNFDAVVDFDAVMRDPARPDHLSPAYDSGDGLHPSLAGYRAMGDAVPLDLFKEAAR